MKIDTIAGQLASIDLTDPGLVTVAEAAEEEEEKKAEEESKVEEVKAPTGEIEDWELD